MNIILDQRNKVKYSTNNYNSQIDNYKLYYTNYEIKKFSNQNNDENININIPKDTIRFEADILFRRLVDYCEQKQIKDINNKNLFNSNNKNNFYKFLLNN